MTSAERVPMAFSVRSIGQTSLYPFLSPSARRPETVITSVSAFMSPSYKLAILWHSQMVGAGLGAGPRWRSRRSPIGFEGQALVSDEVPQ